MTVITKDRNTYMQEKEFDEDRFHRFIMEIYEDTPSKDKIDINEIEDIYEVVKSTVQAKDKVEAMRLFDYIIRESNDKISSKTPEFTDFSASAYRRQIYKMASKKRGFDYHKGYGDTYSLVKHLSEEGIYGYPLLEAYTEDEIRKVGELIEPERDKYFDYSGLYLMSSTYLKKDSEGNILELPQERFLVSALYLMKNEPKDKRFQRIKDAYYVLSNHYVGLATPTLKNSGSSHGTLSSCHIITMDDDLKSIFNANTQAARFSQNGAGLGVYLGFLRSGGSWIRGTKGVSSGTVHPARLLSVLAEYVDQTGTRKAGVAAYLPVWHGDIFTFLELRLKTGSQERRAHSIKTAVTIPDEFMRRLDHGEDFTLFDPYEVKKVMGFDLNRMYDKKKLGDGEIPNPHDHQFTYYYRMAEQLNELELKQTVNTKKIYKEIFISRKTGGTPYMYWTDTAARMNPNGHAGMPFGSNLC